MSSARVNTVASLRSLLAEVLSVDVEARRMTAETPLLGSVPELDSLAVVGFVAAIEERFGILFEDEDLTESSFATLGTLASVVDARAAA